MIRLEIGKVYFYRKDRQYAPDVFLGVGRENSSRLLFKDLKTGETREVWPDCLKSMEESWGMHEP
jgi:hypothetical protein